MNDLLGVIHDGESGEARDSGHAEESASSDRDKQIAALIDERTTARKAKDWARADAIRDELLDMGIAIKDGPEGTNWEHKSVI